MASWVEVANLAGAAIGARTRITDPADNRTLARNIRAVWDTERRAALRAGSWNFAMRREQLGAAVAAPKFGFAYSFPLPADCLRLIEIHDMIAYRDYQLEGGAVLANAAAALNIRYIADVTEPALWDAGFAECFAFRIAWTIGTRIAGSSFDKEKVWRQYREALAASERVDAMENPPIAREESDWITARHAGTTWMGDV